MNDRKLIYCVDDEENIREVYSYALKGAGLDVETFDGWSSLSPALQKRLPDLLLLDIMLDGADGYEILKKLRNNGVMELIARINAKLRSTSKKSRVFVYQDISVDDDRRVVTVAGKEKPLTLKQYELLKLFVTNPEKVMPRDELLDKVWGEDYGETRTLDVHIGDLRKILENSATEISTVRGVGYILK